MTPKVPSYLAAYAGQYARDPREAARQWFRQAGYGLFMHFGLYSLLGRHEWVQFRERIRVAEYAELARWFRGERFDPEWIADFAADCGMKYVNLTTRHHDSFCLWDTRETDFNVTRTPCGRDLVGELARACDRRGLGLCLYYSHGRDWKHPHAPNNDRWGGSPARVRPARAHLRHRSGARSALLSGFRDRADRRTATNYGPIAAIWLDGIAVPLRPLDDEGKEREGFDPRGDGDVFRCQELYDHIHALRPQRAG